MLYCTCGLCLSDTEELRKLNQGRYDMLSIANRIKRKSSVHGARHGKSQEQTQYHQAFNAWKRCRKRTDEKGIHHTGILDRFFKDATCRASQQRVVWTEAQWKDMDA